MLLIAVAMGTQKMFDKIDKMVIRMQHPESGVPVKMQKRVRISVPQSLSGYELVDWIMKNLQMTDLMEAMHFANILCHFGYIFPVFEWNLNVKDDNTLYRFQIPYFWPSHNRSPENVEYAIYLSRRLMRSEEKHGLEDYEAEAYNKSRELLGHIWDFITAQAEIQLKLLKDKKKIEKVILDSQEKAFWQLHRPQPNTTPGVFDEHYGKDQPRILKRKTLKIAAQEVERFKACLRTKPYLKIKKQIELLVSWCEQFSEYDPLISGSQPSNPWVSDEPALWSLNADNVEVPTEMRVRRWGLSVQELIRDPIGRQVLETFLESEFSQENIRFWMAAQDIKYSRRSEVEDKVDKIYQEFLASGAACQVNVDSKTLESVKKAMTDESIPRRYIFTDAEEHIFILMWKDSYPRFLRSEIYKGVLKAAQQQGSKRIGWKNFLTGFGTTPTFGGGPNKKPSVVNEKRMVTDVSDGNAVVLPDSATTSSPQGEKLENVPPGSLFRPEAYIHQLLTFMNVREYSWRLQIWGLSSAPGRQPPPEGDDSPATGGS